MIKRDSAAYMLLLTEKAKKKNVRAMLKDIIMLLYLDESAHLPQS